MKIALITLFPEMFTALSESGITSRAINNKLLSLQFFNPRNYTDDKYHTVDDRPYGGGPGMVMKYDPIYKAIAAAKESLGDKTSVIYLSPQGDQLNHANCQSIQANHNNLILLCGRYEGIDERIIETLVDIEYSIGDYVLSGGELPAMVLIDAITRFIPSALGHADSAEQDSFSNGLLDHPHYTRPEEINGLKIPPVLASGNHQDIARWRTKQSLLKTWQKRPDLLKRRTFMPKEKVLLKELGIIELTEDKENE